MDLDTKLPTFNGITQSLQHTPKEWRRWYESGTPEIDALPGEYEEKCNKLQRMILLRCIRPDRVVVAAKEFVASVNSNFIKAPEFNLEEIYKQSRPTVPVIFILSAGADPTEHLLRFAAHHFKASGGDAEERGLFIVPLSGGMESQARNKIKDAIEKGNWVLLSNTHLLISYLTQLEVMMDQYKSHEIN